MIRVHATLLALTRDAVLLSQGGHTGQKAWIPRSLIDAAGHDLLVRANLHQPVSLRIAEKKAIQTGLVTARDEDAAMNDLFNGKGDP